MLSYTLMSIVPRIIYLLLQASFNSAVHTVQNVQVLVSFLHQYHNPSSPRLRTRSSSVYCTAHLLVHPLTPPDSSQNTPHTPSATPTTPHWTLPPSNVQLTPRATTRSTKTARKPTISQSQTPYSGTDVRLHHGQCGCAVLVCSVVRSTRFLHSGFWIMGMPTVLGV
jgi:hypothetical protein